MIVLDYKEIQKVFYVLSYLLSYPNKKWREDLFDCLEILGDFPNEKIVRKIHQFIHHVNHIDESEWIESYVYTFDFGKKTNLYVTYMNTGEQRERGVELLELKQQYKQAGVEVSVRELPDYLPVMLEFASMAEESYVKPIMQKYINNLSEIRQQLMASESYYAILFDVLFMALKEIGVEKLVEGGAGRC